MYLMKKQDLPMIAKRQVVEQVERIYMVMIEDRARMHFSYLLRDVDPASNRQG